jgi:hypothetical protein
MHKLTKQHPPQNDGGSESSESSEDSITDGEDEELETEIVTESNFMQCTLSIVQIYLFGKRLILILSNLFHQT